MSRTAPWYVPPSVRKLERTTLAAEQTVDSVSSWFVIGCAESRRNVTWRLLWFCWMQWSPCSLVT